MEMQGPEHNLGRLAVSNSISLVRRAVHLPEGGLV